MDIQLAVGALLYIIDDGTLRELSVKAPKLRLSVESFRLLTPRLQSLIVDAGALKISEFYGMLLEMPEVENISFKVSEIDVSKEESGSIWLNLTALKNLKRLNIEVAEPCKEDIKLVLPEGCVATARGVCCDCQRCRVFSL